MCARHAAVPYIERQVREVPQAQLVEYICVSIYRWKGPHDIFLGIYAGPSANCAGVSI